MILAKLDAPSVARNRDAIPPALQEYFSDCCTVLEIGSGTGQHAIHFAAALPHLSWQSSDRIDALPGISAWLAEAELPNTPPPLALDVAGDWPNQQYDAIFSANTLHIMSWVEVERFFHKLPSVLDNPSCVVVYGPFNYGGQYSSSSNADFDQWLKGRNPLQGIRDFEAINALATQSGLRLVEDRAMPANNRCLIWQG